MNRCLVLLVAVPWLAAADTLPQPDPAAKTRTVASIALESQRLTGGGVRLPDNYGMSYRGKRFTGSYRICINPSGRVYDVDTVASLGDADEPIVQALRAWTYKPQTANVCAIKTFTFVMP